VSRRPSFGKERRPARGSGARSPGQSTMPGTRRPNCRRPGCTQIPAADEQFAKIEGVSTVYARAWGKLVLREFARPADATVALICLETPLFGSSPNARFRPRRPRSEIASNWARCQKSALCSASIGRCEPFNDDCGGLNDLSIWVFSRIRANCPSHSANKVTWLSMDTRSSILTGHCSDSPIVAPARGPFVPWMGVAASETRAALADGDHCREMAGKLRELARLTHSPGMRRELVDLARRYDRRGDHFDGRPR